MTLRDIEKFVAGVDPTARHYYTTESGSDYTFWEETEKLPFLSDDVHNEAWRFYIHRFTRNDKDIVSAKIFQALDACEFISYSFQADFEQDTGYIHRIWTCEGL